MMLERPYSLLITDDDPTSRETLRDIFEPAGYRTLLAESGEEAIDLARQEDIHLAIMDMYLPQLTGLEALVFLRQIKGNLPSILISGDYNEELLRRALSAQVYCVLAKPLNRDTVIYTVSRALRKFY